MKRFAWWVFWLVAYTYLVSTGGFEGAPAKEFVITVCGLAVLTWPLVLPLVQGYCNPRAGRGERP
jgi:hypothetical protein